MYLTSIQIYSMITKLSTSSVSFKPWHSLFFTARLAKRVKVMFSQASVCSRRGVCLLREGLPTGGRESAYWGESAFWGSLPCCRGIGLLTGVCHLRGSVLMQTPQKADLLRWQTPWEADNQGVRTMRGQYASYWNAFLLLRTKRRDVSPSSHSIPPFLLKRWNVMAWGRLSWCRILKKNIPLINK